MSAHPKDEMLLDFVDGEGPSEVRRHVARCAECAARVEEARAMMEMAREVDVPEPPPFFWAAFRNDLRRRIAEERPRAAWRGWLLPLAAVSAAAALALVVGDRAQPWPDAAQVAGVPSASPEPLLPAWSALPPVEEDEAMTALEGLFASETVDWGEGRGLGSYPEGLSEEDVVVLTRALGENGGESVL